jgi:hypothetical protein
MVVGHLKLMHDVTYNNLFYTLITVKFMAVPQLSISLYSIFFFFNLLFVFLHSMHLRQDQSDLVVS